MKRLLIWVPLLVFALLIGIALRGLLAPSDNLVRSAMVGKPLPAFDLPPIAPGKPGLSSASFKGGEPRLLNVFASWCVPCIAEAPQLLKLEQAGARIDAIAIRDKGPAIAQFLARHGDPYQRVGDDRESKVQLSLGSSGVPETFVVDGQGIIRAQHIGDIRDDDVPKLLKALEDAR